MCAQRQAKLVFFSLKRIKSVYRQLSDSSCVCISVLCMVTCSVVYIVTSRHATCNVFFCVRLFLCFCLRGVLCIDTYSAVYIGIIHERVRVVL
jgi:hypothetical protein